MANQREISFFITVDDVPFSVHSLVVNNLNELKEGVKAFYPTCGENFELSYFDDEGDKIKITCEPEFTEAINFAHKSGAFLSLLVTTKSQKQQEPVNTVPVPCPSTSSSTSSTSSVNPPAVDNLQNPFDQISQFLRHGINEVPLFRNFVQNPEQIIQVVSETVNKFGNEMESFINQATVPQPEPVAEQKPIHRAICDACDKTISGIRYKCLQCPDYDLCESCEANNDNGELHDVSHIFAKIHRPSQSLPGARAGVCPYRNGGAHHGRGFGRFHRLNNLEQEVADLKKQVEQIVEKKSQPHQQQDPNTPIVQQPPVQPVQQPSQPQQPQQPQQPSQPRQPSFVVEPIIRAPAVEPPKVENPLLAELRSMGFTNEAANLRLLNFHNNNLEAVIDALLNL